MKSPTNNHREAAPTTPGSCYCVFHLNLAFSSIPENDRREVISACYWPLLGLVENLHLPLGIELSGFTLETINTLDPSWTEKFRSLLHNNSCELLASGDSQVIGPLVPARVNRKNLELGLKLYQKHLAVTPRIAYINEQAISSSLLDLYLDAGFAGVMMEWDNPYSLHPEWPRSHLHQPVLAKTSQDRTIPLLWNWSIAFQKLQRVAHDQLTLAEYEEFVAQEFAAGMITFPVYGNDVEIFDYRPGRFETEAKLDEKVEWKRLTKLFTSLKKYRWLLPGDALENLLDTEISVDLTTPESPIVVKKQKKYNITRWAVSGRNDLYLNTACHKLYRQLLQSGTEDEASWRSLCRLWASDLRTFITPDRLAKAVTRLPADFCKSEPIGRGLPPQKKARGHSPENLHFDRPSGRLTLETSFLTVVLNMKRGGTIHSLHFHDQSRPVIGTILHGHFNDISLGADYYSNHCVLELIPQRRRITDLSEARWDVARNGKYEIEIMMGIDTPIGIFKKVYTLKEEGSLECSIRFPFEERPEGVIRSGSVTLLDTSMTPPIIKTHYGGWEPEFGRLQQTVDHTQPASTLVSASNGLSCTEGELSIATQDAGICLKWDPQKSAPLPLLTNITGKGQRLTRIHFSLSELDETFRSGGSMLPFTYKILSWSEGPGAK